MEEYLEKLLTQIRCKKARPFVEEELRGHMEDQISDYMAAGMDRSRAKECAVKDMGDPVETGISLDRIHRPRAAWGLILLIVVISLTAVVIHGLMGMESETFSGNRFSVNGMNFAVDVLAGIGVMLFICFIDYTTIARYAKLIAAAILALCFTAGVYGVQICGITYYIKNVRFSIFALMLFYVPVYGAVLYQYYHTGYRGFARAVLWMVLPVFGALRLPNLMLSAVLLVSMMVQITIAVSKGWFLVSKKKVIAGLWFAGAGLPVFSLVFSYMFSFMAEYQRERIRAFLTSSKSADNITNVLRSLTESGRLVGKGTKDVIGVIPGFDSDYIFTYLTAGYGMLAGVLVLCILTAVIFMIFGVSVRQKNQLGMVMGCGCGMVFLLNTVINVMENMGWLPLVGQTFLPFFSAGASCLVMSYGMIGMILSIYRYKDVYPGHVKITPAKRKQPVE